MLNVTGGKAQPTDAGTLEVPIVDVTDCLLQMRMEWVDGEDPNNPGVTFQLAHGVGGAYLELYVQRDGKEIAHEAIDVRQLLPLWVPAAIERAEAKT
ncbi:MAG: hypothetical protein AAGF99_00275 [Bacteroidota bacterium]